MTPSGSSRTAGQMLADLTWTQALARSLVGAAGAEDVAQEAWLVAVRRRGEAWPPSRAWLSGTVRRMAARRWRSAGRRVAREESVARTEDLPSTAELVARNEEQQRVAQAVLELEEPYRTTLLLRFQEGLETAEIARRQGAANDTARWRVRKGLSLLRDRLERDAGPEWRTALLPLLGSIHPLSRAGVSASAGATELASPTTIGGLLLGTKLLLAVAASALAIATFFLLRSSSEPATTAAQRGVAPDAEVARFEESQGSAGSPRGPSASEGTVESARSRVDAPVEAQTAGSPAAAFIGRVVDEAQRPLQHVEVSFIWGPELHGTKTAKDGTYRLELAQPHEAPMAVVIGADPFRETKRIPLAMNPSSEVYRAFVEGENDLGTTVLSPAGVVAGRVLREDGSAVAKPWMLMGTREEYAYPGDGGTAWGGEAGSFSIGHIVPGDWTVEAQQYGIVPRRVPVQVRARQTTTVDITALDSPTISGHVLTVDGAPLAGVKVEGGTGYFYSWGAKTNADGSFTLHRAHSEPAEMNVHLDGWDAVDLPLDPVEVGTSDLVVHMEELPQLRVRVVDAKTDRAIQQYELKLLPHEGREGDEARRDLRYGTTETHVTVDDPSGEVQLFARPGIDALEVTAGRSAPRQLTVEYDDGSPGWMTVRIARGLSVTGRVTWRGQPVPNAEVRLDRTSATLIESMTFEGVALERDEEAQHAELRRLQVDSHSFVPAVALDSEVGWIYSPGLFGGSLARTRTRADGTFRLEGLRARGSAFLTVVPPETVANAAVVMSAALALGGDERAGTSSVIELGDIALKQEARIRGRVVPAQVARPNELPAARLKGHVLLHWCGTWMRAPTDEEGRFLLERLQPGDHLLRLDPSDAVVARSTYFAVRVAAGETLELELPLGDEQAADVELTILANGEPLANTGIELWAPADGSLGRAARENFASKTDDRGVVRGLFRVGDPHRVGIRFDTLHVQVPEVRVALDAGESTQLIELELGSLQIAPPPGSWPTSGTLHVSLASIRDTEVETRVSLELRKNGIFDKQGHRLSVEDGSLLLDTCPVGKGTLELVLESAAVEWSEVRDVRVEPGNTTRVTF